MASRRKSIRREVVQGAAVYDEVGKLVVSCLVRDLSAGGAKLELDADVPLPKFFSLSLTRDAKVRRYCEAVWQISVVAGVRFRKPSPTPVGQT